MFLLPKPGDASFCEGHSRHFVLQEFECLPDQVLMFIFIRRLLRFRDQTVIFPGIKAADIVFII